MLRCFVLLCCVVALLVLFVLVLPAIVLYGVVFVCELCCGALRCVGVCFVLFGFDLLVLFALCCV